MKSQRPLVALLIVSTCFCSVAAAQDRVKRDPIARMLERKRKERDGLATLEAFLLLKSIELTEEQRQTIKRKGNEAQEKVTTIQRDIGIPDQILDRLTQVEQMLKEIGKPTNEFMRSFSMDSLSSEQAYAVRQIRMHRNRFNAEVLKLLTEDQKKALPKKSLDKLTDAKRKYDEYVKKYGEPIDEEKSEKGVSDEAEASTDK
ncbi:MAG: hypothetical protein AAGA03_15000 [Planctomycetota bacterium]